LIRYLQKSNLAWIGSLGLPLLVLALAAFVYNLHGFEDTLLRDYSIYLYSGQRMAEGIPPYVSVFDHKGPLSPMLAALGVAWSKELNWDDVYTVRLVFYTTACLTAVAVYLLGKNAFRSQVAGLFGALAFLGFYGYAQPAASGPEPKTPMVLFETLSLLFAVQKRWFWAGLCGSLAFLVWQPMAIFPFVALVLAVTRPKEERYGAALRAASGIATPLVIVVAYFYYHDALDDFLDGFVFFNFLYIVRGQVPLGTHLAGAAFNIALPYSTMLVPIILGLVMILRLYLLKPFPYRFAPIVLSFPAPVLWSLRDFQLADDFYVFLPYAAIGFGALLVLAIDRAKPAQLLAMLLSTVILLAPVLWSLRNFQLPDGSYVFLLFAAVGFGALLAFAVHRTKTLLLPVSLLSVVLLTVALANTFDEVSASAADRLKGTDISLNQQREGALEVEERLGEDARLASINSPQVLVLLHQENPNPYLWLTAGVDRAIEGRTPGGFEGWIRELEASDPDAIAFFGEGQSLTATSHFSPEHSHAFYDWLRPRYQAEKIGPWWLYIRNSP
jgi:hypothetical protein